MGTLRWGELTGGVLRRRDRLALFAQALRIRWVRALSRRGLASEARRIADVPLEGIRFPDSKAARDAADLCASVSSETLFNHCMRTYVWGVLLASCDEIKFDGELLFVASLLHDLGLTARHQGAAARCRCFALEGALAARRFALSRGWPESRCNSLADAICLHLNVRVPLQEGAEAHLLQGGAALDVIGARVRQIPGETLRRVDERYPRLELKRVLHEALKERAIAHPGSRVAFLYGLGFAGLIERAPFAE